MPASAVLVGSFFTSAFATVYSQSVDLGTASPERLVIVCATGRSANTVTMQSVTIGGVAATPITGFQNSGNYAGMFYALVPTGGVVDVVATWNVGMARGALQIYSIYGATASGITATAGDTTADPVSATATGPGIALAVGYVGPGVASQRSSTAQTRVVAGPVSAKCATGATAVTWTGSFSTPDFDRQLTNASITRAPVGFAVFYDLPPATATVGTAAASASATGVASSTVTASGQLYGVATASAAASSSVAARGTAAASSTAAGAVSVTVSAAGGSAGAATVTGVTLVGIESAARGTAMGGATAAGVGASTISAAGVVAARSTASADAASDVSASGLAAGWDMADGRAEATVCVRGLSVGHSDGEGVGAADVAAGGAAGGSSTADGVGRGTTPVSVRADPSRRFVVQPQSRSFIITSPSRRFVVTAPSRSFIVR